MNAVRVIQRNCASYLKLRNWQWWRLFTKVCIPHTALVVKSKIYACKLALVTVPTLNNYITQHYSTTYKLVNRSSNLLCCDSLKLAVHEAFVDSFGQFDQLCFTFRNDWHLPKFAVSFVLLVRQCTVVVQ